MMKKSVERIRETVRVEASTEAARILKEAREQVERLLGDARRAEEEKGRARRDAERARCEREVSREIARAHQASRLALLGARNRAIDEIFAKVREEVLNLSPERYVKMLRVWFAELDSSSGGEIIAASRDTRSLATLIEEANKGRAHESRLTLSKETAPFESGFIFRTARYEVEISLDSWLGERKAEMSPRIEKELFGEGRDRG
ncbi:MAG: V-type ATP synthase subunit E family protein [bacterium]|jgi:vacuolar-type H+-ATPase subunit E/Vma4